MTDQVPRDASEMPSTTYEPEMLKALGLLTVEASRLEGIATDLFCQLTNPVNRTAALISIDGLPLSKLFDRVKLAVATGMQPSPVRTSADQWAKDGAGLAKRRNTYVHSRWLPHAGYMARRLSSRGPVVEVSHPDPSEIKDLAREIARHVEEGAHLGVDLAVAGFGNVVYVDDSGARRQPAATDFPVPPSEPLGRPAFDWRGDYV